MGQVALTIQKLVLKLGDNMNDKVTLLCDMKVIPAHLKNIVLPAQIGHLVGYRRIHIISPQTKEISRLVADFLTSDRRYCNFFSILETEPDDDGPPLETDETDQADDGPPLDNDLLIDAATQVDDLPGDGLSDGGRSDNEPEVVAQTDDSPPVDDQTPVIEDKTDDNEKTESEKKQSTDSKKPAKKPGNGRKKRTAKKPAKKATGPTDGGES